MILFPFIKDRLSNLGVNFRTLKPNDHKNLSFYYLIIPIIFLLFVLNLDFREKLFLNYLNQPYDNLNY